MKSRYVTQTIRAGGLMLLALSLAGLSLMTMNRGNVYAQIIPKVSIHDVKRETGHVVEDIEREVGNAGEFVEDRAEEAGDAIETAAGDAYDEIEEFLNQALLPPVIHAYILYLENQVDAWKMIPNEVQAAVAGEYGHIDLGAVRYAENIDTVHGQGMTIENNIYFPQQVHFDEWYDLAWLLHELEHSQQYAVHRGLVPFLTKYFVSNACIKVYENGTFDLHDCKQLEQDADNKSERLIEEVCAQVEGCRKPGLTFVNQTDETHYISIGRYEPQTDRWISSGWWSVDPGDSMLLFENGLVNQYYYFYAESASGAYADVYGLETTATFWLHPTSKFDSVPEDWSDSAAQNEGYERAGFIKIDAGKRYGQPNSGAVVTLEGTKIAVDAPPAAEEATGSDGESGTEDTGDVGTTDTDTEDTADSSDGESESEDADDADDADAVAESHYAGFYENFSTLDEDTWRVYGGVDSDGSALWLSDGPYAYTRADPFPETGDFIATIDFRYTDVAEGHCSIGIMLSSETVPAGMSHQETNNYMMNIEDSGVAVGIWWDHASGLQIWYRSEDEREDVQVGGGRVGTSYRLKVQYWDGGYGIFLNEPSSGDWLAYESGSTPHRPTVIWMGHPADLDCGGWDTLWVEDIEIQSIK